MSKFEAIKAAAARREHGSRARYVSGCRCDRCRAANSAYETQRARARAHGDWNGTVSAEPARRHILKMSKAGVGYKTVADAAGVADSIVFSIRKGSRPRIRARTERLVLGVDKGALEGGARVDASGTWELIGKMRSRGMTKGAIAAALGGKTRAIQFGRNTVLASTALRVRRLYTQVVEFGPPLEGVEFLTSNGAV